MTAASPLRTVMLLTTLASSGLLLVQAAGCTSGTTPECDDAGSCLIFNPESPGAEGGEDAAVDAVRQDASRE
jgi:hypothetical protein